jgi:Fe-S-cluster containining protein
VTEAAFRPIDDVGLRLPKGMPEDIAEPFLEYVVGKAGTLRGSAAPMAEPMAKESPLARLRFVLDIAKQHVLPGTDAIVQEFANAPAKIECRAGCSFCCHQNVDVTIPEAILIALRLADPEDPRRSAVLSAAEAFAGVEDDARIALGRPCPLLIDKRCSVYEDRPIACRSLTSPDAERCDDAMRSLEAGEGVLPIEVYLVLQFLCNGEQSAMRGICRDVGLQDDIVELTQTVAAILRDETLVERWAKGERVFTPRD